MKLNTPNKQDEYKGEDFFLLHLNLKLLLCQGVTSGRVYNFKAGNFFSILTCHTHGGAAVTPYPRKIQHFVVQHLACKGAFAVVGLPCGKEHWTCSRHLWTGSVVVEGLEGGLGSAAEQSLARASALWLFGGFGPAFPAPPYWSPRRVVLFEGCTSKAQNPA